MIFEVVVSHISPTFQYVKHSQYYYKLIIMIMTVQFPLNEVLIKAITSNELHVNGCLAVRTCDSSYVIKLNISHYDAKWDNYQTKR